MIVNEPACGRTPVMKRGQRVSILDTCIHVGQKKSQTSRMDADHDQALRMDRRTFLKIVGMGGAAFAAGCDSHPERHLYTLVHAPDDMVTGEAAWYASTCRECPAGCGLLAKNREGRVIKLEGNPLHPVNRGKLCVRGQAALQGLYNPDRLKRPVLKVKGKWQPISFEESFNLLQRRLADAAASGTNRIAMLTETVGQSLATLFSAVLKQYRAQGPLVYEPYGFESLKAAHSAVFGQPILPGYRMDHADLLIGFGADFVETWLSPVEYARKFKAMHAVSNGRKGRFVHVGPYQSLTAANADTWLACRSGTEAMLVLALIHEVLKQPRGFNPPAPFSSALLRLAGDFQPGKVALQTDVPAEDIRQLGRHLLEAKRPLVLPTQTTAHGAASLAADLGTVLLNLLLDPKFSRFDFDQRHRVEITHPLGAVKDLLFNRSDTHASVLLLNNVNPVFALPDGDQLAERLAGDSLFVVVFSNFMDETAAMADLVIPPRMPLSAWDAYESKQALVSTLQPAAGQINEAPQIGDLFLRLLPRRMQWETDYQPYLMRQLSRRQLYSSEEQWLQLIRNGGRFVADKPASHPDLTLSRETIATLENYLAAGVPDPPGTPVIHVAPSLRFFDGRGSNRPWLAEIPEAISLVAWQTAAFVSSPRMIKNHWIDGDIVNLSSKHGQIEAPVYGYSGVHEDAVVIPLGQGHTRYGRYAIHQGVNPLKLLGSETEALTGTPDYSVLLKAMTGTGRRPPLATVSGSRIQHGRKIAMTTTVKALRRAAPMENGLAMNDFPLALPLPEGYAHERDIYPPHGHAGYRWGMVVDLDRCVGCGACVAACYAENNVGVVGEQRVIEGREMAWLRIERYEDPDRPGRMIFLPMLCQHCDNAPCESVCPVYAPHHATEGLNNQIYNRCIGTRFCAQNCPYKVRRFNWFDWTWPEPLDLQLNPDVTVRGKGVMEKCSFCIQRIKHAHNTAKNENRAIREGEVVPACAQTCPTDALVFGNLMNPGSAVRRLVNDQRAYQVMGYLNTKPAVIYLKKVV